MHWKEEIRNRNEVRQRLKRLAWLLDSSIPIPGTRLSVGIDALIGLVPVLGDLVGVLLSGSILVEAARIGVVGTGKLGATFELDPVQPVLQPAHAPRVGVSRCQRSQPDLSAWIDIHNKKAPMAKMTSGNGTAAAAPISSIAFMTMNV